MNYKYFVHKDCTFYPCHTHGTMDSCLFCWCPLYLLECGGDFQVKRGLKDCSDCLIPHVQDGYEYILEGVNRMVYRK